MESGLPVLIQGYLTLTVQTGPLGLLFAYKQRAWNNLNKDTIKPENANGTSHLMNHRKTNNTITISRTVNRRLYRSRDTIACARARSTMIENTSDRDLYLSAIKLFKYRSVWKWWFFSLNNSWEIDCLVFSKFGCSILVCSYKYFVIFGLIAFYLCSLCNGAWLVVIFVPIQLNKYGNCIPFCFKIGIGAWANVLEFFL